MAASATPEFSSRPSTHDYDVLVVGGGPAGGSVVSICSWLNKRVCGAVSKIHRACGAIHGDPCGRKRVPWSVVEKHLQETVQRVAELPLPHQVDSAGHKHAVRVVKGAASMVDENTVAVTYGEGTSTRITADCIILATGSTPARLPGVPFDGAYIFDSDDISTIGRTPHRILIQGAGIIGLEYAFIMRQLGAEVVLVEFGPFQGLLASLDANLREAVLHRLKQVGITLYTSATVEFARVPSEPPASEDAAAGSVELVIKPRATEGERPPTDPTAPITVFCDAFMAATGRRGTSASLGLEGIGIKPDRMGRIPVHPRSMWTGVGRVYACGDVAGPSIIQPHGLVTSGQAQGIRAVFSAFVNEWPSSKLRAEYFEHIPVALWLSPEVSCVGLTEQEAGKRYDPSRVGTSLAPYATTVKNCVEPREGWVKLVFRLDGGEIVGAHLFGDESSEMVHYGAVLVNTKQTVFDVVKEVMAGVTYHEAYRTAGLEGSKKVSAHLKSITSRL